MKLSGRDGGRIAILAGLAATEFYFIYRFIQQSNLEILLFVSTATILLFATFYWIEWLIRRRVTNFHVCMLIGAGAAALICWHKGDRILSIAVACGGLFFAVILLRRLLRPLDKDQLEANLSAYRAEENRVSPIKRNVSALIAYAILGTVLWVSNGFEFPRDANFLFILALWNSSMLIYHMVKSKRTNTPDKPSVEDVTQEGGRA